MDAQSSLTDAAAFAAAAQEFAERLSLTVQSVAGPRCERFEAVVSTDGRPEAYVRQEDQSGILLTKCGKPLLRLEVQIRLVVDQSRQHLKTVSSRFRVFAEGHKLPVFRYDFDDELKDKPQPAAHVQFHGEHVGLAEAMKNARRGRSRSTRRGVAAGPNVSDLHFPVGGSRFRPCLEDVLEMLILEFRIDPEPDLNTALEALAVGRLEWRDRQLRTAIRDDPPAAADQLRQMGYQVSWAEDNPEPVRRDKALRRL